MPGLGGHSELTHAASFFLAPEPAAEGLHIQARARQGSPAECCAQSQGGQSWEVGGPGEGVSELRVTVIPTTGFQLGEASLSPNGEDRALKKKGFMCS